MRVCKDCWQALGEFHRASCPIVARLISNDPKLGTSEKSKPPASLSVQERDCIDVEKRSRPKPVQYVDPHGHRIVTPRKDVVGVTQLDSTVDRAEERAHRSVKSDALVQLDIESEL